METNSKVEQTELFEIYFSKDKRGGDRKFSPAEKNEILKAVDSVEKTIMQVISFSKAKPKGSIYRVPIIFEKVSKNTHMTKHQNHFAMIDYLPIGVIWNKTVKYGGIEIKSKTAIISLCPMEKGEELFETVIHELIHAFFDSFIYGNGVNKQNEVYFVEGLTEFLTMVSKSFDKTKAVQ